MSSLSSQNPILGSLPSGGNAPQVSEGMTSVAWMSAGAVTAGFMVLFLNGGFRVGAKASAK